MQNMRASRETELAARFPLHVVVQWLGDSTLVAAKHYLSVRDEDFAEALRVVQNPVQHAAVGGCTEGKGEGGGGQELRDMQAYADRCSSTQRKLLTLTGF